MDLETAQKAAEILRAKGVKNVLITLGSAGAFLVTENSGTLYPCAPGIKAVDPTAAGDSFIGAFCVGVCSEWSEEKRYKT